MLSSPVYQRREASITASPPLLFLSLSLLCSFLTLLHGGYGVQKPAGEHSLGRAPPKNNPLPISNLLSAMEGRRRYLFRLLRSTFKVPRTQDGGGNSMV